MDSACFSVYSSGLYLDEVVLCCVTMMGLVLVNDMEKLRRDLSGGVYVCMCI
jgi:hypothetical protein